MASQFAQIPVMNAQLNCIVIVYMQIRLTQPQMLLCLKSSRNDHTTVTERLSPGWGWGGVTPTRWLQLIIICRISTSFDPL